MCIAVSVLQKLAACPQTAEYRCVDDALHSWGAWRSRGYAIRTKKFDRVFGGVERGRFWATCSTCGGKKKISAVTPDGIVKETCPNCRGWGGYFRSTIKVEPAVIPRTGPGGMHLISEPPGIIKTIDEAVGSFDIKRRAVALARYVYCPTRRQPINRLAYANQVIEENSSGRRMSSSMYSYLLTDIKTRLAKITGLPLRVRAAKV